MEQNTLNMGLIIRDLRKAQNMTQDALAQAVGVSVQAVSKWETGMSLPDIALLPDIADYFDVTIDALFGRESFASAQPEPQPETIRVDHSFPDDGKLRVAQFLGSRLLTAQESAAAGPMSLIIPEVDNRRETIHVGPISVKAFRIDGMRLMVEVMGDAQVGGPVTGDLKCHAVTCQSVGGDVEAFGAVTCENIYGDLKATSGDVHCGTVAGDVSAQGDVTCGNVAGDISAGGQITCETVNGDVSARGDVSCGDVDGDVKSTAGSVQCGKVCGDVSGGANVTCDDVDGDVSAGGDVTCGDVDGDLRAGGSVHRRD